MKLVVALIVLFAANICLADSILPIVETMDSNSLVNILFNESLDRTSAETISNYSINSTGFEIVIYSATLQVDNMTVVLETDDHLESVEYILIVNGVKDLSGNATSNEMHSYWYSDNLPNDWEENYFVSIDIYNDNDDPDGDGISNLDEYNNGTDPSAYCGLLFDDPNLINICMMNSIESFYWTNHPYGDLNNDDICDSNDLERWENWGSDEKMTHKQICYQKERKAKVSYYQSKSIIGETTFWELWKSGRKDIDLTKLDSWQLEKLEHFTVQIDFHYDPNISDGKVFIRVSPDNEDRDNHYIEFAVGKDEQGDYFSYEAFDIDIGLSESRRVVRTQSDGKLYISHFPKEEEMYFRYEEGYLNSIIEEKSLILGSIYDQWSGSSISFTTGDLSDPCKAYLDNLIFKYAYHFNKMPVLRY